MRMLKLLQMQLEIWIDEVKITENHFMNDKQNSNQKWLELFQMYVDIQKAFKIYKKVYAAQKPFVLLSSDFGAWVIKNIILHTLLCGMYEKFYTTVNEAQYMCTMMLSQDECIGEQRIMCKNILRLNKSPSYMYNLMGLFQVDAKLLLSFVGLLATYAVVLLQFYFDE
ncbi:uncharacterized protein LOC132903337 [Amyelois transitella]|uniref:uncharacterized protein LOC132903337 n=1 Tax=Amyelois transitella TaxID=680683 RepID=UPI00298F6A9A|nr:uncharacterized protein LOC132903337 [Amyelois transitella]